MLKTSVNSLNDFIYAADQQHKEVNTGGNLKSVKAQSCNPGSSLRAVLHTGGYAEIVELKKELKLELPHPANQHSVMYF